MQTMILSILVFTCTLAGAQTKTKPAPCTFRTHREWSTMMVPRIERSFGILTSTEHGDKPLLIRLPKTAAALPAQVTSTACVNRIGDDVYVLTAGQLQELLKLK